MRHYLVYEHGQASEPVKVLASDEDEALIRLGFTNQDAIVVPCCDGSDPLCSDCERELAYQAQEEGFA